MMAEPTQTPSADAAELIASISAQLPQQYELLARASQGGMGTIFKAKNRFTERLCAIKVLSTDARYEKEKLLRFVQEAKAASSLDHPNICRVYDFGATEMPYLVMDWIDGISLDRKVARDGPLAPVEAEQIFAQVIQGMTHAHEHRVIHRDLKPENIMLSRDKATNQTLVHLVDFGIAKVLDDNTDVMKSDALTRTGIIVGTPMYMSPEQARGKDIDGRADIYSLGCAMYFSLVGVPPFQGDTLVETLYKHIHDPPAEIPSALKIPHGLKMIMLRCMEKKPDDRYQTMPALAEDLQKHITGAVVVRPPLSSDLLRYRRRIVTATMFIVSFTIAYGVSILLQNLMDTVAPEEKPKTKQAP